MKSPRKRAISKAKFYEEVYDNRKYWTNAFDRFTFVEITKSEYDKFENKTRIMGVDVAIGEDFTAFYKK